jgi:hypothetical protein
MSRIRSIKPEAFTDEKLWDAEAECGLPLFRAFPGLWTQADREGRFEWRPRVLKAAILPYWEGDFATVLDVLERHGFVASYEVDGRRYGVVLNFLKHQYVNTREAKSKLPCPPTCVHVRAPEPAVMGDAGEDVGRSDTSHGDARACTGENVQGADAPIPSIPVPDPAPDPGGAGGTELQRRAEAYVTDPNRATMAHGPPERWPEVIAAANAFRDVWPTSGKLRSRDTRAVVVVERLAQGYTVEQLAGAARGAKLDTHIAGNAGYQTISTVWRDAAQVDRFLALLATGGPKPKAAKGADWRPPDAGRSGWESTRGEDSEVADAVAP